MVAARHHGSSTSDCVSAVLWALIYFFHYIYSFNLSNQYTGAEEDKINKPDRPILSGLVTVEGARFRWYVVTVLYHLAGLAIGNVWSSLLWILDYLAYNMFMCSMSTPTIDIDITPHNILSVVLRRLYMWCLTVGHPLTVASFLGLPCILLHQQ